ncbi:Protein of unknown function [Bacillus cereus]|uniref:Uncharacterized protein n=1 Tax=Bacillus thuringiensis TaxID=1428 RepID=A0A1C4A667_BACTU|nr:Protein of unknown function [Bacillus cereus]SCB90022.1 Protein of unknown function [Bacillus thuringiensis]SCN01106.1 Protein of unknown function [Bacillus wiedmannii]SCN30450.1 Protein of unknown function [Bacillus wiedmannii]SCN31932.1 Protein of unknown function [Bacillus cereus]
MLEIFHDTKD